MENHTEKHMENDMEAPSYGDCIGAIQRNHLNEGESHGEENAT